jgi:hypothetical protein
MITFYYDFIWRRTDLPNFIIPVAIINHHIAPRKKCEKVSHQKTRESLAVIIFNRLIILWNSIDAGKSMKNAKKNGHDSVDELEK